MKFAFPAMTTDKLVFLSTGGRAYSLMAPTSCPAGAGRASRSGWRSNSRTTSDIATGFVADPERRRLRDRDRRQRLRRRRRPTCWPGTRKGKQVMNVVGEDRRWRSPRRSTAGDTRRDRRREPQASGLPARRRCRRWPAARACGCSATRTAASRTPSVFAMADGSDLEPTPPAAAVHAIRDRASRMARRPGAGRTAGAEGLPEDQSSFAG